MIAWTIPGTVAGLTGVTTVVESSSSSRSGSAQYGPVFPGSDSASFAPNYAIATGSFTENATYTFAGYTSHDAQGSTTYFSSSSSYTFTEQWGLTGSAYDDDDGSPVLTTTNTLEYSNSNSGSASQSGQTTANLTALVETSTTETYESAYESVYTTSYEAEYEGQAPVWTTSEETIDGGTGTRVVFYQTDATSMSAIALSYLTREATSDAVTVLDQTITLSAIPNTVVQAETRYPNAEVIYLQTSMIENVAGYTAASDLAQSGTRFTVSPIILTAAKQSADYSRPTSSIGSLEATSLVLLTSSTFTQNAGTRTVANYNFFPPTTTAQSVFGGMTTTAISYATNVLSFRSDLTYGGTTNTVSAKEFRTYWRAVTRQIGSKTFQAAVQDTTSYTVTQTIEAAASSSTQNSSDGSIEYGIFFGLTYEEGESASETYRSSGVTGNTVLPTARALIDDGSFLPSQSKYGTFGAAFGSQKGGWITANATSQLGVFFSWIYALDGNGRIATTMFPVTNEYETINATGISWTESTTANLSLDGATSKKTTTSASFGVSGPAQTTGMAQPIGNFGGSAGEGETFVQAAFPGVYKDRISGSTTSFDGSATVITAGQSEPLVMWRAIRGVTGMVSSTNANPATWTEARNSTALPPAMPPDA